MAENIIIENWSDEKYANFNSQLEERILEANHDDTKVKWSKLLPEFLDEEIFIAGQLVEGQTDEFGNPKMNIIMVQNNNHSYVPFFTSPDRLAVLIDPNNTQINTIKLKVYNFFLSVKGRPAMLNPMSAYTRVFTPFEIKILTAEYEEKQES